MSMWGRGLEEKKGKGKGWDIMGWGRRGECGEWRSSCVFIQSTGFLAGGCRSKTVKF